MHPGWARVFESELDPHRLPTTAGAPLPTKVRGSDSFPVGLWL